jgi:hypothetical protein
MSDVIANGGYGTIRIACPAAAGRLAREIWLAASALGPMGVLEVATVHARYFLGARRIARFPLIDLDAISAASAAVSSRTSSC